MLGVHSLQAGGLTVALGLVFAGAAGADAPAQKPPPTSTSATAVAQPTAPVPQPCAAAVIDVYKEVPAKTQRFRGAHAAAGTESVQLRDTIAVKLAGLECLLKESESLAKEHKAADIVLYIDDRPLPDVFAFPPTDPNQNILRFPLRRTEDSREVWTYVLGRPTWKSRETKVSIGLKDKYAIPSRSTVSLSVLPHGWFLFWILLFAVFLIGFFILARNTDILRDAGPAPPGAARRPYSLARTQASCWFFLILASYMFIGMITGDFSTSITPTVLILMGISSATAVGAALIDASKSGSAASPTEAGARQRVQAELVQTETAIQSARTALLENPNDMAAAETLHTQEAERRQKLSQLHKLRNESEHFLQDLLSDANGVNFHRFQMVAWTVVLGIIFVGHVYKELAMPEFNGTLLSLMGISAGTYLGLKIPEDTVPEVQ